MVPTLHRFYDHFCTITQRIEGWFAVAISVAANYIVGYETSIYIVLFSVILDLIWGIAAAIKQGRFTTSELARETISKLSVYATVICFMIALDKLTPHDISITESIIAGIIVLVELWSFMANALIVYPNMPLLVFFKRMLTGELANKLGVPEDEVEETLNKKKNGKD